MTVEDAQINQPHCSYIQSRRKGDRKGGANLSTDMVPPPAKGKV